MLEPYLALLKGGTREIILLTWGADLPVGESARRQRLCRNWENRPWPNRRAATRLEIMPRYRQKARKAVQFA
jgi:hypothetical protein